MDNTDSKSILTSEVFLRTLELRDAGPMLRWLKNPSIYKRMQYDPEKQSYEGCCDFIRKSWEDDINLHYAITNLNREYMGTISLKNIDRKNKSAELGIVISPEFAGRGIGTKALSAIFVIAFRDLQLNKVYLYVRNDNIEAIGFYKKNNLELEGCFKEHIRVNGEYKDILWFAMRREQYIERG